MRISADRGEDLRRQVAGRLRRKDIPETLWQRLSDEGVIAEAIRQGDAVGLLAAECRRLRAQEGVIHEPTPVVESRPAQLDPDDEHRAEVGALVLARHAAQLGDVRRYRHQVLGRRMSAVDAEALLTSPAASAMSVSRLREIGVPIVDHRALVEADEEMGRAGDLRTRRRTLYLDPPGRRDTVEFTGHRLQPLPTLHVPLPNRHPIQVWPGSVLDDLRRLAQDLTQRYPWTELDAVRFVLTDQPPPLPAIRITVHRYQGLEYALPVIQMAIQPWTPVDAVHRSFREVQQDLLGGENRPIAAKRLAVVTFVSQHLTPLARPKGWATLMDHWNMQMEQEDWRYADWRLFQQDYTRTVRLLLTPAPRDRKKGSKKLKTRKT